MNRSKLATKRLLRVMNRLKLTKLRKLRCLNRSKLSQQKLLKFRRFAPSLRKAKTLLLLPLVVLNY